MANLPSFALLRFDGYFLLLAVGLCWFGWHLAANSWRSMAEREGMFDPALARQMTVTGWIGIVLGAGLLFAGLAVLGWSLWRLF